MGGSAVGFDMLYTARRSNSTQKISQLQENLLQVQAAAGRIAVQATNVMPGTVESSLLDTIKQNLVTYEKGLVLELEKERAMLEATKTMQESNREAVKDWAKSFNWYTPVSA